MEYYRFTVLFCHNRISVTDALKEIQYDIIELYFRDI